jgi:hypothetical protein
MNFKHSILVPANISILPIYVLHQSLIIVFGYYIVGLELSTFTKFMIIVFTAIPVAVLLYKIIQKNTVLRFLFGLKMKVSKNTLVSQNTLVNSQKLHLQVITQSSQVLKTRKNETI